MYACLDILNTNERLCTAILYNKLVIDPPETAAPSAPGGVYGTCNSDVR